MDVLVVVVLVFVVVVFVVLVVVVAVTLVAVVVTLVSVIEVSVVVVSVTVVAVVVSPSQSPIRSSSSSVFAPSTQRPENQRITQLIMDFSQESCLDFYSNRTQVIQHSVAHIVYYHIVWNLNTYPSKVPRC